MKLAYRIITPIFAVGAGAVTKLVKHRGDEVIIKRMFRKKYPYEYLAEFGKNQSDLEERANDFETEVMDFFSKN